MRQALAQYMVDGTRQIIRVFNDKVLELRLSKTPHLLNIYDFANTMLVCSENAQAIYSVEIEDDAIYVLA